MRATPSLAQGDRIGQLLTEAESAAQGYAVTGNTRFADLHRAGWLQLLMGSLLPSTEVHGALHRIDRQTRLQQRLINDLLDISRIIAGKLEVIRSPVDLNVIVQTQVDG